MWPRMIALAVGMTLLSLSAILIQHYLYTRSSPGARSYGYYLVLTILLGDLASFITCAAFSP
jgi:hypothetical protein